VTRLLENDEIEQHNVTRQILEDVFVKIGEQSQVVG
jgi:hypothetical protein